MSDLTIARIEEMLAGTELCPYCGARNHEVDPLARLVLELAKALEEMCREVSHPIDWEATEEWCAAQALLDRLGAKDA